MKNSRIIAVLVLLLVVSAVAQYFFETNKNMDRRLHFDDFTSLTTFYPVADTNYIGSDLAPVNAIFFIDPQIDSDLLIESLSMFEKNYTRENRVKLYLKPIVSAADARSDNERFRKAKEILCLEEYPDYSMDVIKSYYSDSFDLATIQTCIEDFSNDRFEDLLQENQQLGLDGINARVYIGIGNNYDTLEGIPTLQRLERAVRFKEIIVGT